jgi:hypothetical protein
VLYNFLSSVGWAMSEKCIDGCTNNHLLASSNLASKGATIGFG